MNIDRLSLPNTATNLIFTGVAGTGKTHRLLAIQRLYDEVIASSWPQWRLQQLSDYSWCEVIAAALLLEDRMMSVPELGQHRLIHDKMRANARQGNVSQTLWVQLNTHAHPDSTTVNSKRRSANYYFDKTESSHWYVLPEAQALLRAQLADLLALYAPSSQAQQGQAGQQGQQDYQSQQGSSRIQRSCLVSFHQAYGYDEFVEGIRPQLHPQTGQMQYTVQPGAFLTLCAKASADPTHRYAMLIDEINRANTAQVFGELMSVIEPSKRLAATAVAPKTNLDASLDLDANSANPLGANIDAAMPMQVRLAYSGRQFSVPANVDIYATMNTQDQSLATLDTAFRRRFEFIDCAPDASLLGVMAAGVHSNEEDHAQDAAGIDLAKMMLAINQRLLQVLGAEAQLGQSYFMHLSQIAALAKRLQRQIIPQIIQQLRQATMPEQQPELLLYILYGRADLSGSIAPASCLLDIERVMAQQQQSATGASPSAYPAPQLGLGKAGLQMNPAFLAVANAADTGTATVKDNLFLSAQPYRHLYELE